MTAKLLMGEIFVRLGHITCIGNRGDVKAGKMAGLVVYEGYQRGDHECDAPCRAFGTNSRKLVCRLVSAVRKRWFYSQVKLLPPPVGIRTKTMRNIS